MALPTVLYSKNNA